MNGNKASRGAMWVLASGVAAIAAIVSYSHIYDLGIAHGGSGIPARLLPLSVDMLILVGELMLLHEADVKGRRFVLGWVLVWSGILATLAANVAYGSEYGVLGAVIWGWPAYSFILAAGGMVAIVKRSSAAPEISRQQTDLAPVPDATADAPDPVTVRAQLNGHASKAEKLFAADVSAGKVPGQRRVMAALKVGAPKAKLIQVHLGNVIEEAHPRQS